MKWPDLAGVLILVLQHFPYSLLCRAWVCVESLKKWPNVASISILVWHRFPYSLLCRAKNLAWVCVKSSKKWPNLASFSILVLHRFPYSVFCRAKYLPGSAWSPQRNDLTWPAFLYLSYDFLHIQKDTFTSEHWDSQFLCTRTGTPTRHG